MMKRSYKAIKKSSPHRAVKRMKSKSVAGEAADSGSWKAVKNDVIARSHQNPRHHTDRENQAVATVLLGQAQGKPESQMTAMEKMFIAQSGVSKNDLENLKNKTSLDYERLAKALSVTRATLINKKGKETFNPTLSERIVSLADIYSYGYEVFENIERFNLWMSSPNHALGGRKPYDLVNSLFGREEIRNIIGRIDYGVYS